MIGIENISSVDEEQLDDCLQYLEGGGDTPALEDYLQTNDDLRNNPFMTKEQLLHGKRPRSQTFGKGWNEFKTAFLADERLKHLWPVDLDELDKRFDDPEFWNLPPGVRYQLADRARGIGLTSVSRVSFLLEMSYGS